MMKKIIFLLVFSFSIGIYACDCNPMAITEKFTQSDFVANVTITKIYPNQKNVKGYKADIKINQLYKGKNLKSIYVYGLSNNRIGGSSCDIYIPAETKLIAYAKINKDGNYGIGMCSGIMYIDYSPIYRKRTLKSKKEFEKQNREIEILNVLKKQENLFTSKISFREKTKSYKDLEQFKGIELDKKYAIYEITFNSDLTIKDVSIISGFRNAIDKKLIQIIKKTQWSSFNKGVKDKVPDNSKLLIGYYYYKKEKGNPSFLSRWYL